MQIRLHFQPTFLTSSLVFLIGVSSCKRHQPSTPLQEQPATASVTAIGSPIGNALLKTIGSEGETVYSDDNLMRLLIPAGAVSTATEFSIQATTTTNGQALRAFRLLSEHQQFSIPVNQILFTRARDC